jgi:hypothetical protein
MSDSQSHPQPSPPSASFREITTDAIRYWEPRRLLYNAVLALIVGVYFCRALPESRAAVTVDGILGLFVLAVFANLCYCAAYIVDLFAQFSGFRSLWLRWRWLLLALGITFAGIITRFFALGFCGHFHAD